MCSGLCSSTAARLWNGRDAPIDLERLAFARCRRRLAQGSVGTSRPSRSGLARDQAGAFINEPEAPGCTAVAAVAWWMLAARAAGSMRPLGIRGWNLPMPRRRRCRRQYRACPGAAARTPRRALRVATLFRLLQQRNLACGDVPALAIRFQTRAHAGNLVEVPERLCLDGVPR